MTNRTTRAQRINAGYDRIWAEAARLKTETRFNADSRIAPTANEVEPFAIETEASTARWNRLQRVTRERDALIAALQWIVDCGDAGTGGRPAYHDMRDKARAALAKVQA